MMKLNFFLSPDAGTTSATGSVIHFTDLSKGGSDSQKVNKFVPTDEASIVVAMQEFPSGINDFSNYSFIGGVPHNDAPRALREPDAIRFIVLHETSGSDSGTGFNPPFTAHFVVLGDGSIQQFNDLSEIEWHESHFNNTGLGIEFVNLDWEVGGGVKKDSAKSQQLKENDDYLWAYWGDGYNIYKIPPVDRMERLVLLVNRLLQNNEDGFIQISPTWLQLVSYNEVKDFWDFSEENVPDTDEEKDAKNFFIFSNGISYISPSQFQSGILSHNSVSNLLQVNENGKTKTVVDENAHSDGSFLALYTWLRIAISCSQDDAYTKTKELLRNHMLRAITNQTFEGYVFDKSINNWKPYSAAQKRHIHLVDVSGII
jgi:N-acetylmuramoyl-L-alanine amidase